MFYKMEERRNNCKKRRNETACEPSDIFKVGKGFFEIRMTKMKINVDFSYFLFYNLLRKFKKLKISYFADFEFALIWVLIPAIKVYNQNQI